MRRGRSGSRPQRRWAPAVLILAATRVASTVVVLLAAATLESAGAAAQEVGQADPRSTIHSEVDTALVTVGDRITLTVTVDHPAGTRVVWPDSIDLAPFEVLGARQLPSTETGGGLRSVALLTLTAFELGELEIPAFQVAVERAGGPGDADVSAERLATDRFAVEVTSVGTDEGGDIRDIRGPLSIPLGTARAFLWGLLAVALTGLALWLWRRSRRPRAGAPAAPKRVEPLRPPHERALEALSELEASPLLERGQVKEYHIRVSAILRLYVEERFGVDALELTTTEVLDGLAGAHVDSGFSEGLRDFLEQCDLVKFAKARPTGDRSRQVLALGRRLVLESGPVEAAAGWTDEPGAP